MEGTAWRLIFRGLLPKANGQRNNYFTIATFGSAFAQVICSKGPTWKTFEMPCEKVAMKVPGGQNRSIANMGMNFLRRIQPCAAVEGAAKRAKDFIAKSIEQKGMNITANGGKKRKTKRPLYD